jgi:hypothetical protein
MLVKFGAKSDLAETKNKRAKGPKMSVAGDGSNGNDVEHMEAWLTALESMIALLAAQLPALAGERFATAVPTANRLTIKQIYRVEGGWRADGLRTHYS